MLVAAFHSFQLAFPVQLYMLCIGYCVDSIFSVRRIRILSMVAVTGSTNINELLAVEWLYTNEKTYLAIHKCTIYSLTMQKFSKFQHLCKLCNDRMADTEILEAYL